MIKTESIRAATKTIAIESCHEWLQCELSEGVRAAIPHTNNLIMVGPADWIAANVPGVEPVADLASVERHTWASIASRMTGKHRDDTGTVYITLADAEAAVRAATTQAGTAQAEPSVPEGITRADIECAIGETEYKYFGDYEMGDDQRDAVGVLVKCAQFILSATSSTDAQAAAEVRDEWISVDERLPECSKKPGSLGVEVIVYPRPEKGESTAFFGCRHADDPVFYKYGSRVEGITHWMPLPEAPSAIRSAGDTGEQADGGAAGLTDDRILQIASEVGMKVRTGQGAITFARAVLADRAAANQRARHE